MAPYLLHHFEYKPWIDSLKPTVYSELLTRLVTAPDAPVRLEERDLPLRLRTTALAPLDRWRASLKVERISDSEGSLVSVQCSSANSLRRARESAIPSSVPARSSISTLRPSPLYRLRPAQPAFVPRRPLTITIGIPTYNRASFLRETIASVLGRCTRLFGFSYAITGSTDDTGDVVASFGDPRITYLRWDRNIGMISNFNRIVNLTQTDALTLLPDDDILYPEYLAGETVPVLERFPNVGVVHTAFDLIHGESRLLEKAKTLLSTRETVTIESGAGYLERSMSIGWTICFSSALYRTKEIARAEGMRPQEEPFADMSMWMRIALHSDFAFVAKPLVAFRFHGSSATAELGPFTGAEHEIEQLPRIFYDRRVGFLNEATLPVGEARRYRTIAEKTFRRESVQHLANRAGLGAPWTSTTAGLIRSRMQSH